MTLYFLEKERFAKDGKSGGGIILQFSTPGKPHLRKNGVNVVAKKSAPPIHKQPCCLVNKRSARISIAPSRT